MLPPLPFRAMSAHPAVQPCGHSHDHCQNKDLVEEAMERARKAAAEEKIELPDFVFEG